MADAAGKGCLLKGVLGVCIGGLGSEEFNATSEAPSKPRQGSFIFRTCLALATRMWVIVGNRVEQSGNGGGAGVSTEGLGQGRAEFV